MVLTDQIQSNGNNMSEDIKLDECEVVDENGLDHAATVLGDIAPTYFVSVAAIVAAFYGAQAYNAVKVNSKPSDGN